MTPPILIVGAGPAGLVLALSLLSNGISVRIIDKEKEYRAGERGAGVTPRSLELYNLLGTLDDISKTAGPLLFIRSYELPGGIKPLKTFNISPYVEPTPQCPLMNLLMIGQNHHERVLRSHLEKFGCHVELGTTLRSFKQHDDHVVAELVQDVDGKELVESAKFDWLVGTDGARSVVRKQLGLSFLGETRKEQQSLIGDVVVKEGLNKEFWHFWGDPAENMITLRPSGQDDGCFSFFVLRKEVNSDETSASREDFLDSFYAFTGRKDIVFGDLKWISTYTPNIRMVDKFHEGRVFIAGDAAHCHSPAGGQGLNSSIQDSFNLGWKLALVKKGLASASLLESYDQERLPVIAEMLNKTTELLNKSLKPGGDDGAAWKRGGELHQLGVNYRSSPLVLDEEGSGEAVHAAYNLDSATAARAGDRAPDAPGLFDVMELREKRLFEIFRASYHTVLVFSGSIEEHKGLIAVLDKLPKDVIRPFLLLPDGSEVPAHAKLFHSVLVDKQDFAYSGYSLPKDKVGVVVVRPDGIVGARVGGVEGLESYLRRIFMI